MIPFVFHWMTFRSGVSSGQDVIIPESVSFVSAPECESGCDLYDKGWHS